MVTSDVQSKTLFYEALRSCVDVPRNEELKDIDKQLQNSKRFVALRGSSGGGKSYFLRRQLVPFYQDPANSQSSEVEGPWRVVTFSPQANPIGTLAAALAVPGVLQQAGATQPFYRQQLIQKLRGGNDGLIRAYQEAVVSGGQRFRLLIVVDQLEDMFKMGDELHKERSERYAGLGEYFQAGDDTLFFNLFLKVLTTEIPIYLVFSIGSESLDRINAFQGWPERISMQRYALPQISADKMKEAFKSFWPEGEKMPAGAQTLYDQMLEDYKIFSGANKEPTARVNIALKLLYEKGFDDTLIPFEELPQEHPQLPEFIKHSLTEGKTPHEKGSLIRQSFFKEDNQEIWLKWQEEATDEVKKKWEEGVDAYFAGLLEYYREFKGLAGAPNHFFSGLPDKFLKQEEPKLWEMKKQGLFEKKKLAQLPKEQREDLLNKEKDLQNKEQELTELTRRLFQTITLKDAAPQRVAESYSVPFGMLSKVCFRNGDEYPGMLQDLLTDKRFDQQDRPPPLEAAEDKLLRLIRHYNFPGDTIPDTVRWLDPAGQLEKNQEVLNDRMIIRLGTSSLVQEWADLREWVENEYAASNVYKKLVQDAKVNYKRVEEEKEATGIEKKGEEEKPHIPPPALLRDLWASLTGAMSSIWRSRLAQEQKEKQRNRDLLSEGGMELVGQWFLKTLPSTDWASKYLTETLIIKEEGKQETPFEQWVEKGKWTAFPLVRQFWKESYTYHVDRRENELAATEQQIKTQQKISRIMGVLVVMALVGIVVAFFAVRKAKDAENNLRLLDFVDSMTKAGLIPDDIYRKKNFGNLKEEIVSSKKIRTIDDVIFVLDTSNVLKFPEGPEMARYNNLSKASLIHLYDLIDEYHTENTKVLWNITDSITSVTDAAMALNAAKDGKNYQYPYVYHALWENFVALKAAALDERKSAYKTHSQINAVESNPTVKNQYAVGDAAGQVRILQAGGGICDRVVPLPESISSLRYSFSGRLLYASSFGGNIYRYEPLNSGVTDKTPCGLTDSLRWVPLRVNWDPRGRGNDLAILSVHNTALPDYLLVMGDTDITLIRKGREGQYVEVQNLPLGNELTALTVTSSNEDGTKFMVGGSDASVLLRFNLETKKMDKVRTVYHQNISASAIAFQPYTASGDSAQQKVAVGTSTGDIWITDIGAFSATGVQQARLMDLIEGKTSEVVSTNFQQSAITGLAFNQAGNEQLISSSLDGTVWIFNLEAGDPVEHNFLMKGPGSGEWDHLNLSTTGRSVDNLCLINPDQVISIENNEVWSWPTNLTTLHRQLDAQVDELSQLNLSTKGPKK